MLLAAINDGTVARSLVRASSCHERPRLTAIGTLSRSTERTNVAVGESHPEAFVLRQGSFGDADALEDGLALTDILLAR
jgi:hypothetical protein